jgi:hypothetical protein
MNPVEYTAPVDAFRKLVTIGTFPARTLGQVSDIEIKPIVKMSFILINRHIDIPAFLAALCPG